MKRAFAWTGMSLSALFIFAVCLGLGGCSGLFANYSDGFRVGTLNKLSNKGLFCASYEGELILEGFGSRATPGSINNTWTFSTRDKALADKITATAGAKVKLTYHQWFFKPSCIDTDYEVTSVEVVH